MVVVISTVSTLQSTANTVVDEMDGKQSFTYCKVLKDTVFVMHVCAFTEDPEKIVVATRRSDSKFKLVNMVYEKKKCCKGWDGWWGG